MANLNNADLVLVTMAGTVCGQKTLTTFPYRVSAVGPAIEQSAAFTALKASLSGAGGVASRYRACCPTNWMFDEIWIQVIRPVRYRLYRFVQGTEGLFDANAASGNVQASITRVGDLAGRRYVGGIRVPIGTGAECSQVGVLTVAQKAAMQALADTMKLNIITAGTVATYTPLLGLPKPGQPMQDLWDAFIQNTTRVIRRRTVGLGI